MPYKVESKEEYVYIKAFGQYGFQEASGSQNEALEFIKTENLNRVLVNISEIENEFTFNETMQIVSRVPEVFPRHVKHAVIFSETVLRDMTAGFSDDFSANRGINVRLFDNEKDALGWLLK
jgi:hypothetical protein